MPRLVRCGLIQAAHVLAPDKASLADVREAMTFHPVMSIDEVLERALEKVTSPGGQRVP